MAAIFDRINSSDFIELFAFPRQLIHQFFLFASFVEGFFFFLSPCSVAIYLSLVCAL